MSYFSIFNEKVWMMQFLLWHAPDKQAPLYMKTQLQYEGQYELCKTRPLE